MTAVVKDRHAVAVGTKDFLQLVECSVRKRFEMALPSTLRRSQRLPEHPQLFGEITKILVALQIVRESQKDNGKGNRC